MKRCFRYLLPLVFCVLMTGCSKRSGDFSTVNDTAEVHEVQSSKEAYWQKQLDINGTKAVQVVINAQIEEMRTDSLCEVLLSRQKLDAKEAEETAARLFDSYEKEETAQEEGICYVGLRDNQPCQYKIYDAEAHFTLSDYRNGLYHFPEGEWAGAAPTMSYIVEKNNSELSSEEAEQIADSFLEELGLDSYRLAKAEDLYWEPLEHPEEDIEVDIVGSIPENTWCEGYVLTYARDIKGVLQDVESYWYTVVKGQMRLGMEYNRNLEEITLYVTDFGVVDAWISNVCDAEERALDGQQVIDLETAKEKFEKILMSDPNRFSDEVSGNRLEFNSLELVYYADGPDHISPVWKLSDFTEPNWENAEGEEVYQHVILLHAISGEEIDPKRDAFFQYNEEQDYEFEVEKVPVL